MKTSLLTAVLSASILAGAVLPFTGCTPQTRARNWGGKATETLPAHSKLVTVAWHQDDLWILTRPMRTNEVPESYTLKESSAWGIIQGSVVIIEQP